MTEPPPIPAPEHRAPDARRASALRSLLALALVVAALLGVTGCSDDAEESTVELIYSREVFEVSTVDELAARSMLVVAGSVRSVSEGPTLGAGEEALGMLLVEIIVDRVFLGPSGAAEVKVLVQGYDPASHRRQRVAGQHGLVAGQEGLWYLWPSEVPGQPGTYYVATSAGQILRGEDGRALTGGDQPAAASLCGRPWAEMPALVERSIRARSHTVAPPPGGTAEAEADGPDVENLCSAGPEAGVR